MMEVFEMNEFSSAANFSVNFVNGITFNKHEAYWDKNRVSSCGFFTILQHPINYQAHSIHISILAVHIFNVGGSFFIFITHPCNVYVCAPEKSSVYAQYYRTDFFPLRSFLLLFFHWIEIFLWWGSFNDGIFFSVTKLELFSTI